MSMIREHQAAKQAGITGDDKPYTPFDEAYPFPISGCEDEDAEILLCAKSVSADDQLRTKQDTLVIKAPLIYGYSRRYCNNCYINNEPIIAAYCCPNTPYFYHTELPVCISLNRSFDFSDD
ncbi:hypothetical protein PTTG_26469 [Puccinia triticina 1-1 BBBD Race 1]|uniref:Uncharacterized protein n=2 Tax=Puccinia triticina TaxID=208348 RepID=A0A180GUT3_PUCT1|nr:uncharacterized protein PtA15_5A207 [Puccinia triticina]OAV96138.1 hypothetical protein PTTG_26469 [Puccinia triticina 1-1 BBBD Race 1]WAQ84634.1 hypothetical protein PtA15_5A207 [Puccinia triticina]WAR57983.1 hypothetical protein PtB15_5B213 [Puccinia triticina]